MKEHPYFLSSCSVLVLGVRDIFCSRSVLVLNIKKFSCSCSVLVREQEHVREHVPEQNVCSFIPAESLNPTLKIERVTRHRKL